MVVVVNDDGDFSNNTSITVAIAMTNNRTIKMQQMICNGEHRQQNL